MIGQVLISKETFVTAKRDPMHSLDPMLVSSLPKFVILELERPFYFPPIKQVKLWGLTVMADELDMKLPAHKIMSLL